MARLPGWRKRLEAAINGFRRAPLAYGTADCAVMAAASVEAITGARPGPAEWYGYQSEEQALATMHGAGFDNLADMTASVLPEIHPAQATVGDLASIPVGGPFGFALGVVAGERVFVFGREFDGLGTVSLLKATRAFRVS